MLRSLRLHLAVLTTLAAMTPALAQAAPASQRPVAVQSDTTAAVVDSTGGAAVGAPVVVAGDTLFRLYGRIGPFTPQDRARAIVARLTDLIRNPTLELDEVRAEAEPGGYDIVVGDVMLMTVTADDAAGAGRELAEVARDYATTIEVTLQRESEAFSLTRIALGALYTILATVVLVLILRLFAQVFPVIYRFIRIALAKRIPSVRFQRLEILSGGRIVQALELLAQGLRALLTILALYFYLPLVLSFFPWTRRLSGQIVSWVTDPFRTAFASLIAYVPDLFAIAVILLITYYGIKLIKQFFLAIQHGTITFTEFYPEWAEPTYKLVRFMVFALAVILIWPHLPQSDSEAFKGVAAFLGLLITFGSAGAISNIVGGVLLIYMRAFRVGDRVQIADTIGDIVDQDLLVTRVRTIKNVDITIPNALVLGAHIINWSTTATQGGVILHTSVTIGYDVPWRQVHDLLIGAARKTDGIMPEPNPFVLQTSLDDFYVSYELNAHTDRPARMAAIYSALHENIQDAFNEAGVEIMSPHYGALRDGNRTAIPDDYLPSGYRPPSFRLWRRGDDGAADDRGR